MKSVHPKGWELVAISLTNSTHQKLKSLPMVTSADGYYFLFSLVVCMQDTGVKPHLQSLLALLKRGWESFYTDSTEGSVTPGLPGRLLIPS